MIHVKLQGTHCMWARTVVISVFAFKGYSVVFFLFMVHGLWGVSLAQALYFRLAGITGVIRVYGYQVT